jgi:hypothetical protein
MVIVPSSNLIKNIGFGVDATNTSEPNGIGSKLQFEELNFPLVHPEFIMLNPNRVKRNFNLMHTSRLSRFKSDIKQLVPKSIFKPALKLYKDLLEKYKKPEKEKKLLTQEG